MARTKKTGVKIRGKSVSIRYMNQDGQRVEETLPIGTTIDQAFKIRAKRVLEIQSGDYVSKQKLSVNEFFKIFKYDYLIPNSSAVTLHDYIAVYNRYTFKSSLGKKDIQSITPRDIYNLYSQIRTTSKATEGTLKIVHAYLRKMFNFAVDLNVIPKNPMAKIPTPKAAAAKFTVWTAEECDEFLTYAKNKNTWTYFVFAMTLFTGLRRSEVLGLQWKDVDFERGVLKLDRTVHEIVGEKFPVIQHGKTQKAMSTIPVPQVALDLLREIRGTHISITAEYDSEVFGNKEGWIFLDSQGKLLKPNWATHSFRRTLNELPHLPKPMNLKGFRHMFATFLLQKNAHPKVVQELMRHSTFKLTMDTYSHVVESIGRDAVSLLDDVFTGAINDSREN